AHIRADLGHDGAGAQVSDPGDRSQDGDRRAKGTGIPASFPAFSISAGGTPSSSMAWPSAIWVITTREVKKPRESLTTIGVLRIGVDLLIDCDDGGVEDVDLLKMQAQKEAVVLCHPAAQRFAKLLCRRPD